MKCVKVDLPRELKEIELHCFADWHLGDKNCNVHKIAEQVKMLKEKENAYCILNGDLLNNATKASVSDVYAEQLTPMQQVAEAVNILEPIKDKIIGMTCGNHELRTYKGDGIDLTGLIARELRIYDRYSPEGIMIFLRFGAVKYRTEHNDPQTKRKMCYTIYATHGCGGGRKIGGKTNRLIELSQIVDADLFYRAHTHAPIVVKQGFYRADTSNSKVKFVEQTFINTAAALDYGGYGQQHEYGVPSQKSPIAVLNGGKKDIQVIF